MSDVNFTPCAAGFVELSTESKDNYWIIRFLPDGRRVNLRNMQVIGGFPNTKLTRDLDYVAIKTRQMIDDYQNSKDETSRRALFWKIKETIKSL